MIHEPDLETLTSDAWCNILMHHPEPAEHCNAWDNLSSRQWLDLLCGANRHLVNPCFGNKVDVQPHPELFSKCPKRIHKKWGQDDLQRLREAGVLDVDTAFLML